MFLVSLFPLLLLLLFFFRRDVCDTYYRHTLTFGRSHADESTGVAEALPAGGLVGGGSMIVHCVVRLTRPRFHTLQHTTRQLLFSVTEAELRTLLALIEALAPALLNAVYRVIIGVSLLAVF